ncbi:MAG: hypothetical protein ABR502_09620 [Chitinophagaceae bacterium]
MINTHGQLDYVYCTSILYGSLKTKKATALCPADEARLAGPDREASVTCSKLNYQPTKTVQEKLLNSIDVVKECHATPPGAGFNGYSLAGYIKKLYDRIRK